MKKLSLFLLMAFLAGFPLNYLSATQYCDYAYGHENNPTFGDANGRILLSFEPTGNANEYKMTIKPNVASGNTQKLDYLYVIGNGNNPYPAEARQDATTGVDELSVTFTNSNATASFTIQWSTPNWAGRWQCALTDVDLSSLASCSGGDLTDPNLTITAPTSASIQLNAAATQQIEWTSSNTATPTFKSSSDAVATVDDKGLVTAVAQGSATITIEQAATDTYKKATKTFTVIVPGDKSKNTQCQGWNDDIWASQGGYNYHFTTLGTTVHIEFTAIGNFPAGLNPQVYLEIPNQFKNMTTSGKVLSCDVTDQIVGSAIKIKGYFAHSGGLDQTTTYTYTVGSDCQAKSVESVSINTPPTQMEVGEAKTLTAIVLSVDATNKNVTWSITSGSTYASINSSTGELTANAIGNVTVQVKTEDGNKTATCDIEIIAAKPSAPSAAPTAPTYAANKVKAVYSSTYSADCGFGEWGSGTAYTQDTYGKKYVTASGGYFGLEIAATKAAGLNCSTMEYLHADVWVKDNASMRFVPIHGGTEVGVSKDLTGGQWNSIDIALTEFTGVSDWSGVYQIKIDQAANLTLWLNNVYFYTTAADVPLAVSATASDGGSASVSASSVTSGTNVTFTATADCGYQFASWTKGSEVIVGAGASYAMTITEETTLQANFTCNLTPASDPTHTAANVMSVYGYYGNQTGLNLYPNWGQTTQYKDVTIGGKTMVRYGNINYQGMDFDANRMNISDMQYMHLDLYASAATELPIFIIWAGGEKAVTKSLTGCAIEGFDIPLSDFTGADLTTLRQLKFDVQGKALAGKTLIVQNIYFYKLPPAAVTGVTLDKSSATLKVGKSLTLTATVAPANAGNKNISWSSDATSVATVVDGVVTAVAEGTANIKVTTEDGGFEATCAVTVNAGNPDEVELKSGDHTIVYTAYLVEDNTYELTLTSEENLDNLSNGCYWHVNGTVGEQMKNKIVADSDPKKIVVKTTSTTAPQMYTPLYVMMPGEVSFGQPTFTWIDKRPVYNVESVAITNAPATMDKGEQFILAATITPANATNKNIIWSIASGSEYASIDATTGELTANAAGSVVVQVTTEDGNKTDTKAITISSSEAVAKTYNAVANKDGICMIYSITFNVDRTLTYAATFETEKTGLDPQININGVFNKMANVEGKYQYTTTNKYTAGSVISTDYFYIPYAGGATTFNFTYTVGQTSILLNEGSNNAATITANNGKEVNVFFARTFIADGYWYTLCLPFSLTAEQLAAAYGADYDLRYLASSYMKSEDMMYLNFEKATELQAGMPYMFKPAGNSNENYPAQTFEGVVIDNSEPVQATTVATMTGYYSPMVIETTNYVLGSDDYLYRPNTASSKAFRCYFTLNPPTSAPVRARCIFNDSHIVTNLDEQSAIINQQSKMIIGGRLIIIRDGKKYNAQGARL